LKPLNIDFQKLNRSNQPRSTLKLPNIDSDKLKSSSLANAERKSIKPESNEINNKNQYNKLEDIIEDNEENDDIVQKNINQNPMKDEKLNKNVKSSLMGRLNLTNNPKIK